MNRFRDTIVRQTRNVRSMSRPDRGISHATREPLFSTEFVALLHRLALHDHRLNLTGLVGRHASPRRGASPEFSDFKPYTIGDDFRRIDWKTFARSDELFVRESEATSEMSAHLLIDVSPSMDWTGDESRPTKLRFGLQLAGLLSWLSLWQFDRLSVLPVGAGVAAPFAPTPGRAALVPTLRYLERLTAQKEIDLSIAANRYVERRKGPAVLVLISDLLSEDPAALTDMLGRLGARRWHTVILQIEDPAEADPESLFDAQSVFRFRDLEDAAERRVQPGTHTLATYHRERNTWLEQLSEIDTNPAVTRVVLGTDTPLHPNALQRLRDAQVIVS